MTLVSARNIPPFVSLIATINASVLKPNRLPSKIFATINAIPMATANFAAMMPKPRLSIRGAAFRVIFVPTVNRYMPSAVGYPAELSASVKPPIFSRCGKKVLTRMPRNSGTTMRPPGILVMVWYIFILP